MSLKAKRKNEHRHFFMNSSGKLTIPSIMNMVMKSLNLDIMRLDDEQVEIEARDIWQ